MVVNACVIVNGKVIPNTFNSSPIARDSGDYEMLPEMRDETIGYVVRRAVELARAQGYHMADPNAFVRVEFK